MTSSESEAESIATPTDDAAQETRSTESPAAEESATASVRLSLPQVASWVGSGANEPVTAAEITQAIGEEELAQFADALGKDPAVLAEYLAGKLPEAVDAATSGESAAAEKRSRIDADTLLILFDRVPDQVTIREPAQGISFGLDISS